MYTILQLEVCSTLPTHIVPLKHNWSMEKSQKYHNPTRAAKNGMNLDDCVQKSNAKCDENLLIY